MNIDISQLALSYVCLLFSLCFHEAAHAVVANRCGDPSARLMGRASLNPLVHIDLVGTVILPLFMMFTRVPWLFGWAKPVPYNPRNLRNMRRDPVWIALAGPGSNLVLVALSAVLLRIVLIISNAVPDIAVFGPVKTVLLSLIMVNLVLLLFNMIPIPPLDGHHVLEYFLPPQGQRILEQVGRFGILIAVFVAQPWLRFWLPRLYDLVTRFVMWGQG